MRIIKDEEGKEYTNKDICDLLNSAENEVSHLEYAIETLVGYDRVDYLLYLLLDAKDRISQGDIVIQDFLHENEFEVYQKAQMSLINYLIKQLRK